MTGEMVERAAEAAYLAHRPFPRPWLSLSEFEKKQWIASAQAAIETMREPTEA